MEISSAKWTELIQRARVRWPNWAPSGLLASNRELSVLLTAIRNATSDPEEVIYGQLDIWLDQTEEVTNRVATAPPDPVARASDAEG